MTIPREIDDRPRSTLILWATALALLPALWVLIRSLRAGIVVGNDSLGYFAVSDSVLCGGPISSQLWAPGYALLLSAARSAGANRPVAAAVVNACAFGLSAVLAIAWVRRMVGARSELVSGATLLILSSSVVLDVHRFALSDAVFLVPHLASLFCVAEYLSTRELRWLLRASAAGGVGVWFRYAGIFSAGPLLLAPLLVRDGTLRQQLRRSLMALTAFGVPVAAMRVLLLAWAQDAVERPALAWHPPTLEHLAQWGSTVGGWFLPTSWVLRFPVIQWAALALSVLVPVAGLLWLHARNRPAAWCSLQALAYLTGVLASVTLADHNIPLDSRVLLPYFVALVGGMVSVVGQIARGPRRMVVAVLFTGAALWYSFRGVRYMASLRGRSEGYDSIQWRADPLLGWIRRLPADCLVLSNASGPLRFHVDREIWSYPQDWDAMEARPVDGLGALLSRWHATEDDNIVLIYYPSRASRQDVPLERVLAALRLTKRLDVDRASLFSRAEIAGVEDAHGF